MKGTRTNKNMLRAAQTLVLALLCVALNSFSLRAQAHPLGYEEQTLRIYYPYNSASFRTHYMTNRETLNRIDALLGNADLANSSIEIISYSSPEGDYNYNYRLSERRAKAARNYLETTYPALVGKITLNPGAESWQKLRNDVMADERLDSEIRDKVLDIIDSDADPDRKEYSLSHLPEYRALYANYFSALRYAEIKLRIRPATQSGSQTGTQTGTEDASQTGTQTDTQTGSQTGNQTDTHNGNTDGGAVSSAASSATVYYVVNESEVRPSFLDNDANLMELRRILSGPANIRNIVVVGSASPEGSTSHNEKLAARRAEELVSLIIEACPQAEGKITVVNAGENWDGLRAAVLEDPTLSDAQKEEVVNIIDSNYSANRKERLLKKTSAWETIEKNIFPLLRSASITNIEFGDEDTTGDTTQTGTQAGTQTGDAAGDGSDTDSNASSARIYYVVGESEIRPSYMDNEANIMELRRILSGPANVNNIVVVGSASPDGPASYNEELAARRAEEFVKLILEVCPQAEGKITVVNAGENWDGLRAAVLEDPTLSDSQKEEVISIIDSNCSADRKERLLKKTSAWKTIEKNILPNFRSAGIAGIEFEEAPQDTTQTVVPADTTQTVVPADTTQTVVPADTTQTITPSDTTAVVAPADTTSTQVPADTTQTVTPVDTTQTVAPVDTTHTTTVVPPVVPALPKPILAVSTNALADLAITPNFAVEVPIGKKWSVYGEYTFPWWVTRGNDRAYEMLKWDLGARYRLGNKFNHNDPLDILNGHFVGVDLSAGYYDFEPHHTGYQGEFQMISLEYGYAWNLGKKWRLDASVGAGWMGTHYRYYEADPTDQHLVYQHSGKFYWLGPTKLNLSIKYIFTTNPGRAAK